MAETIEIAVEKQSYLRGLLCLPEEDNRDIHEKLLVVMIHGFPGDKSTHDDIFLDFEAILESKHFHSFRFDFRGCGGSDGREEAFTLEQACTDLKAVKNWASDQGYERFMFIAEGLGASIALQCLEKDTACIITLWPMIDLDRIASTVFNADEYKSEFTRMGYAEIDQHRVGAPLIKEMRSAFITPFLKSLATPLLVMHGAKDEVSPLDQIDLIRMNASARRVEITTFHDGEHGLPKLNHRKTMFYHMMQFIEKYA